MGNEPKTAEAIRDPQNNVSALIRSLTVPTGIVFIGPDGDVMRRLGDKISAKRLAEQGQQFWRTGNGVWLTDRVPAEALKRA